MPLHEYKAGKPWKCTSCSRELQVSKWYEYVIFYSSLALTATVLFVLGLRMWQVIIGTLLLFFPVVLISLGIVERFVPSPLEPYGGKDKRIFLSLFQK